MSLIRFSNQYPSLFDSFANNDLYDWSLSNYSKTNLTTPSVNIKESSEGFSVEVAAPGLDKTDFKVSLDYDLLTISSEKKSDQPEGTTYSRREFSYQNFARSFTLPKVADGDKISASYDNGILRVFIPKKDEAKPKPARSISIS